MLFVQSLRGLSHTKLEDTKPEHLELSVAGARPPGHEDPIAAQYLIDFAMLAKAALSPALAAPFVKNVKW